MSDLVAQFGLDDRAFDAGLQRAERRAVTSAQRIFSQTSQVAGREARRQEELARKIQTAYTRAFTAVGAVAAGAVVAFRAGVDIITEYGERFGHARGQAEDLTAAMDRFKVSMGRDLAGVNGGGFLAGVVNWGTQARETLFDVTAAAANLYSLGLLGSAPADSLERRDQLMRLEAMDSESARSQVAADERLRMRMRAAEVGGDQQLAAELRVEMRRREENRRLAGLNLSPGDRDELRDLAFRTIEREEFGGLDAARRAQDDADRARRARTESGIADRLAELNAEREAAAARDSGLDRVAAGIEFEQRLARRVSALRQGGAGEDLIGRMVGAEREAFARESDAERNRTEQQRTERAAGLDQARQMLEVERLRWRGQSTEADVLRAQLEYRRLIAEVQADELLTIEQKAEYSSMYQEAMGAETAYLRQQGQQRQGARSLPVGLTSRVHLAQALGPGAGDTAARQLREAQRTNELLEDIAERTGTYA